MRINEVEDTSIETPSPDSLLGLVEFLAGRAQDTNSQKQISQDAFIKLAQSLDININPQTLPDLTLLPPLSNVLEPLQPGTQDPIVFKGGEANDPTMPVNKAQDIVAAAAKKAANKKRGI